MSQYHENIARLNGLWPLRYSRQFGYFKVGATRTIVPYCDCEQTIGNAMKWLEENELSYVCCNWNELAIHEDTAVIFKLSLDQTGYTIK